jgi:hypothetical protein
MGRRRAVVMAMVAGAMLAAGSGSAAVLCKKRSGVAVIRDTACRAKETPVALASLGAVGPTGPTGADGPTGVTGPTGPTGTSALAPLGSGQTVSGAWGTSITAAGASEVFRTSALFPVPLAAALDGPHVRYISGASGTHCPGVGQADPGYLCLYQGFVQNVLVPGDTDIFDPIDSPYIYGASRFGFSIFLRSNAAGAAGVHGAYSVTAP